MSQEDFPSSVASFIRGRINSVTQLEILLLLYSDPQKEWTALAVSSRLSNTESSVKIHLARLASSSLITIRKMSDTLFYRSRTDDSALSASVKQLADAYAKWRFRVIDAIFAEQNENLRNFSESFRLRKENEDV